MVSFYEDVSSSIKKRIMQGSSVNDDSLESFRLSSKLKEKSVPSESQHQEQAIPKVTARTVRKMYTYFYTV